MRTLLVAIAGGLVLAGTTSAQATAAYHKYGQACHNSIGVNMTGALTLKTQTLPNEYCYGFKAPKAVTVLGFAIYTQKATPTGLPLNMDCGFYNEDATGTAPLATQATKGATTVDNNANWYTCIFAAPQAIKKDESFWVSGYDSNTILASSTTNGAAPALRTFWRRPAGGGTAWSPTGIVTGPGIAIIVKDEAPVLEAMGVPKLGNATFGIRVFNAQGPANLVTILLGISDTKTLGGVNLPFDLGQIGFHGCTLYASDEFYLGPMPTSAAGVASITLPVPTTPSLSGLHFYNQAFVVNITARTVSFTNAGKATVGN